VIDTTTSSVEATRGLGRTVAEMTRPGDLVLLAGDLGAGKTAFTQGFAEGLGVTDPVTSPTFTLAHRYEGRIRLHHLDVYRLEQAAEIADLDVPELLDDDAVTIIEWGDAIRAALPADYLEVRLAFGEGDDDRVVTMIPVGPSWSAREPALRERTADRC
jgi:tRNA threonylcarbamoyladenosine biosynthesis protein TsaE